LTRYAQFNPLYWVSWLSKLVRSDKAWKVIFKQAGLRLIQEKVQDGLPEGLFVVKM
jgi:protein N-terminal methyltransferase